MQLEADFWKVCHPNEPEGLLFLQYPIPELFFKNVLADYVFVDQFGFTCDALLSTSASSSDSTEMALFLP